ncbi:L-lactate dehydrogenase [Patescibacteria group bacterium]|nr:MAG: L-lactate dehydrogenase [Patescibacteria group bacterium]
MPDKKYPAQKIAVIGAGAVGSTVAYTDMVKNLASEVLLIDLNEKKEKGEVMDIADGLSFVETGNVKGADFKDAADADIIVVTAGLAQKPGETRLDLVKKNRAVIKSIFKSIGKIKPSAIVIMISNPVDVLTHVAQKVSGLPRAQVFGTGTALDTARLRHALAVRLKVNAHSVSGFVLGEHGDSEFAAWSTVTIGGAPVTNFIKTKELDKIAEKVKNEAYEIINRKGATFYGIALTVADIIEAVLYDQNKILPLSVRLNGWNGVSGVCLGVPAVLGRKGIVKIWPLKLPSVEQKKFKKSAEAVKKYL